MPQGGGVLGPVKQGTEVVDLLHGDLVIERGSDQLQLVGPQLDALLQRLVDLGDIVIEGEPLLSSYRGDGEGSCSWSGRWLPRLGGTQLRAPPRNMRTLL